VKKLRIYLDSSVIGGCLDVEFAADSNRLMKAAEEGKVIFVLSEVVFNEIRDAPPEVQAILTAIQNDVIETISETNEVINLRDEYLEAKILTPKSRNDATHVALATVARVDAIVSWNFKHIVRLDKIKAYNQVNFKNGYGVLQIVTPKEVLFDE
jgi:predicted nucleic acid-binding protein